MWVVLGQAITFTTINQALAAPRFWVLCRDYLPGRFHETSYLCLPLCIAMRKPRLSKRRQREHDAAIQNV